MRIKCPHCNGKGFSEINSALNMTCGWCMGQGELDLEIVPKEPQTEQEYLQTCTTEQLANAFFEYRYANANPKQKLWMSASEKCIKTDIVEWLKQPHHEKE